MPSASIQLAGSRTAFSPRETLTGKVSWQLDHPPTSAELRLVWNTRGRGQTDFDIVETIPFPDPQLTDTRPFSLKLPDAPYSFFGTLIQLSWTLELEVLPGKAADSVDIILAPGGEAITLPRISSRATAGND